MSTDTTGAAHDLSGDELALVLDAACAVVLHLDVASGDVRWSGPGGGAHRRRRAARRAWRRFLECVHPDDRAGLRAAVAATAHDGATSTRDLRVVWPDGAHALDRGALAPGARRAGRRDDRRHRAPDRRRARRAGADALPGRRQRGARRVAGHGAHAGHDRRAVRARPRRLVLDRSHRRRRRAAQRRGRARRPRPGRARPADARALPAPFARRRRHRAGRPNRQAAAAGPRSPRSRWPRARATPSTSS